MRKAPICPVLLLSLTCWSCGKPAPSFSASSQISAPAPDTGARQALQALKALQSATTIGVGYRDYAMRAQDAQIKVDQSLELPEQKNQTARDEIQKALRYYQLALLAWSAHIAEDFRKSIEIGRILEDDKDIFACPGVKEIVAEKRRGRCPDVITPKWASEACYVGWLAGKNPAILWGCASDKIAEAERLMK